MLREAGRTRAVGTAEGDQVGSTDAVVVGAGINGMAAAAELASSGWSVALVDANPSIGGFLDSGELTVPGYQHDAYASWHPLFVAGPVYQRFGEALHRHGLEYRNTEGLLTATVSDDGAVVLAYRDVEATVAGFADPADREAYHGMIARFGADANRIGALLGAELHSLDVAKPLSGLALRGDRRRLAGYLRDTVTSGRSWLGAHFRGPEADRLWAPWLLHAGLAPDSASGGLMLPVLAATLHAAGLPVVAGGARRFVEAWSRLLAELGVVVHTGRRVDRILVRDGRAVGVGGDGFELRADRAVLASVTPGALYRELLPADAVPERVRVEAARFRPGRGVGVVHVALSGPVPWAAAELRDVPLVHLSDGSAGTAIACAEAQGGLLPRRPTVVVGQQHVLDPGRVPDAAAALWLQLQEVPFAPVGDATGELDTGGGWTPELAEGYTERVLARVAAHAPGLRELVLGARMVTPVDLLARNPNAVEGDPYGGSAELDQNFWWRPLPSAGHHRTPVPGLWHIGASTHPGAGLGGVSGYLAARRLAAAPGPLGRLRRPAGW
jgi:phytoene dehydrogenase-like protein